jgi:hypothetical protein
VKYVYRHGRHIEVETRYPGDKSRPKKRQWQRQFVRVPWSWVEALKDAKNIATYRLAFYVLYEHWRNGGRPVKVSGTAAARMGVNHDAKRRGLQELDSLKLVNTEGAGNGRAPYVTPISDE